MGKSLGKSHHFPGLERSRYDRYPPPNYRVRWTQGGSGRSRVFPTYDAAFEFAKELEIDLDSEDVERKKVRLQGPRKVDLDPISGLLDEWLLVKRRKLGDENTSVADLAFGVRDVQRISGKTFLQDMDLDDLNKVVESTPNRPAGSRHVKAFRQFAKWCACIRKPRVQKVDLAAFMGVELKAPRVWFHTQYTQSDLFKIFHGLAGSDESKELPKGQGLGRNNPISRALAIATKNIRWRMSMYAPAMMAYAYGSRPSTFIKLRKRNWDPVTRRLFIRGSEIKTGDNENTGQLHYFQLDVEMAELINACIGDREDDDEPIFLNIRGRAWKPQSFSHAFGRYLRQIGFKKNKMTRDTFYALRHTGAKEVCRHFNGDLTILRVWLKHTPTSPMALRYIADLRSEQEQELLARRHDEGNSSVKSLLSLRPKALVKEGR